MKRGIAKKKAPLPEPIELAYSKTKKPAARINWQQVLFVLQGF